MQLIDKFRELGYNTIPHATGFKICCPFHHEETPSCSIDEGTNSFKCFGCGESGKISKLLSSIGIDTIYEADLLELKKTKVLNKLADAISEFKFQPSKAKPVTKVDRGISVETFNKFQVYLLDGVDSYFFPIRFRGKNMGYVEKVINAKYVNHFTHGYIPYNIDKVHSANIILVEGVFDALSVYQAGYPNVIASLSASYSNSIINWLKRINATNVQILYDGDEAGIRGAKALHLKYLDSKIIWIPEGEDPNSLTDLKGHLERQGVLK